MNAEPQFRLYKKLKLIVSLLLILLAVPAFGLPTVQLTIQAYNIDGDPVPATVLVSENEVGVAWTPVKLVAGVSTIVVTHNGSRRSVQVSLLSSEAKTISVNLGTPVPMIQVEPGTFQMGSPADEPARQDDEKQHRVTLTRGYWIAITEVSQTLYEEVTGVNPSRWVSASGPVDNVTWFDCVHFCNTLSSLHGFTPVYSITESTVEWDLEADGYRLPTEAEWEYACRAGSSSVFSFGDDPALLHFYANYCDQSCERDWRDSTQTDGYYHTSPVASFKPNAWGLYDMHGNLWEWCWDWWKPFDSATVVDPLGPSTGNRKAERGGCWDVGPGMCRQAYRHYVEPDQKRSYLGFRIVRTHK